MAGRTKVVVVGDGVVGKTCILLTYNRLPIPDEWTQAVFENTTKLVQIGDRQHNLELWDTAGQEDLAGIRVMAYPGAHIILICFAVDQISSLRNVCDLWSREVKQGAPNATVILVGTKMDLRSNPGSKCITTKEGRKMAKRIKANGYIECSSLVPPEGKNGVDAVFNLAIDKLFPRKRCSVA